MKLLPLAALAAVASSACFAQTFSVPRDPALPGRLTAAAKSAEGEGKYAAAVREYKRLLEVFPNDPMLQAPVYLAMSVDEGKAGDADKQQLYASISKQLDPSLQKRTEHGGVTSEVTRGGGSKADTMLALAQAALSGYIAVRAARQQSAPPPPAQQAGVQYPAAPYGQPGYQPPPNNQYAAQPGYDPNQNGAYAQQGQYASAQPGQYPAQPGQYPAAPNGQYQQPGYPQQPQASYQGQQAGYPQPSQYQPQQQPGYPQQQAQPSYQGQQTGYPQPPQPPQYQPQPQQQAGYSKQPAQGQYPQPAYPQQPQYPVQAGQSPYPQQGAPGQYQPAPAAVYYQPTQAPYGVPANGYVPGQTRGQESAPIKVVYDTSTSSDSTYFAKGCGALLTVDNGALLFTPGCGLAPRLIPAGDVWEVRMNNVVGRDIGAFHIITRKGLYLDVAPSDGTRDQAQTEVDTLRKSLSVPE